jgi:predicted ABC-type ATPase
VSVPTLIIIAGPNGAGKTTFAREYLSTDDRRFEFVNADEIAGELTGRDAQASLDFEAARSMLRRVNELVEASADFVVETTLANLTYAQKIPNWRRRGYLVSLVYLRLDSAEEAIARVHNRVAAGGHGIPEKVIRRRFGKSSNYFETIYRPIVDEWYIWASREGSFSLIGSWDGRHETRT